MENMVCDQKEIKFISSWDELEPRKKMTVNYLHPTTNVGLEKGIEHIKTGVKNMTINFLCLSSNKLRSMFSIKGKELHFNDIHIVRNDSNTFTMTSPMGEGKFKLSDEFHGITPSGKLISDYILSKNERDLLQFFVMGQKKSEGGDDKQKKITRLPVDISKGSRRKGGFTAFGDDKMEKLDGDLFRLATIDEGSSLQHCLLKLLNSEYRAAHLNKRIEMADGVKLHPSLSKISEDINHGILVKDFQQNEDKRHGKGGRWIILFEHSDGSYEPIVHKKEGKIDMVFSEDSSLIQ
jgi:hypothetical protein